MDTTEIVFAIAIAILYPFFFNKLANQVTNLNKIKDMCKDVQMYEKPANNDGRMYIMGDMTNEYKACNDERKEQLEKAEFHKHLFLLAMALIGLVLSSFIQTKSTKLGVGLGGVLTLITALSLYWHRYNESTKLIVLGLNLLFVMYFSVRLYKLDSVADIFSIELGTK